ncbi:unnamed protein product [Ambrosiozyma monospora]|uniref:Unnamed protein product n=1 Tax=Ambrosiozyma monospora TaxID=43982 RepID=A0A9W6Z0Z2_AMBMO|nr:unnamed protein product [Ambrosiozyma monospora]
MNVFKLDIIIAGIYDKDLNLSGIPLYKQAYGDPEVSYKIYINVITASVKSSAFALQIWNYILGNDQIFHFLKPLKRTDTGEQWKRIQLLVLMVISMKRLEKADLIRLVTKTMVPKLFKEASPLCRMYIEWMIAYTVYTYPESKDEIFVQFEKDIKKQAPLTLTAFERISVLIARQLTDKNKTEFIEKFAATVLIPSATSNRALNRHFSVSLICSIQNVIEKKELVLSEELTTTMKSIYQIAANADGFGQYRSGDALLWDISKDFTLVGLNGGVLLKISDREIDAVREKEWLQFVTDEQKQLLNVPIGEDDESSWVHTKRIDEVKVETFYPNGYQESIGSSLLQTKSGAWSTVIEVDSNTRAAASIKRSPLIVVASLVDKAPNLGGICRLSDVLGAGWLTLNDLSVKDSIEFKSVAVTADRWMPMIEVKIEEITEFMRMKKKEGYSLIGLEQTDNSVELNSDLKFPEKSLILLGKEKEGIPGDLLAELDQCVIIKQVGVIRSMNIQTATAVIVHAYSSQHC